MRGKLNRVSDNPAELSEGSTVWIICGPAHIHQTLLAKIAPFVAPGSFVGTIFSQGGFDWVCQSVFGRRIQDENLTIFGLYTIPWICKATNYGERVRLIGPKQALHVAVNRRAQELSVIRLVEDIYDIPTVAVPNFLSLTLTPSNQIIHPGRVYGVFKDWDGKTPYKPADVPLFYEDLDEFSGLQLKLLDDEIQLIKREINRRYPDYDLSIVLPLKDRIKFTYGDQVKDNSTITTTFRTNAGYRYVQIPTLPVEGGVIPNIKGRIFWEDVPYGLCILHDLARLLALRTPAIDKMIYWHQQFMDGKQFLIEGKLNPELIPETGTPTRYGYKTIEQVLGFEQITPKL